MPYVPRAQGSLALLYVHRTRSSLGRAVRAAYRVVHPTGEERFRAEACTGGKMLGVLTCEG